MSMTEFMSAIPHMTALEYVRTMPLTHIHHQHQVNKQLWEHWNAADHARALQDFLNREPEEMILSSGVEIANGRGPNPANGHALSPAGEPPALTLSNSVSTKHWERMQKECINARIGEIFFVYNATQKWGIPRFYVSYVTERVDTPGRWKHYCVHHLRSESVEDVIRSYNEHMQ